MVYGVLRFINFAHSDVFMVGAFVGYYVAPHLPENNLTGGLLALCAAMVACAVLGVVIERFAYRPLRNHSRLNVLITAIGVSLLLENAGQKFFGADPKAFPSVFPTSAVQLGTNLVISTTQVTVLIVTALLLVGLQFIVQRVPGWSME